MDKSIIAKSVVILTLIYDVIGVVCIVCESIYQSLYHSNYQLARSFYTAGSMMAPFVLLLLPFLMIPASFVLSVVGIVKSKKLFPYLICPPVPIIIWIITVATYARYI